MELWFWEQTFVTAKIPQPARQQQPERGVKVYVSKNPQAPSSGKERDFWHQSRDSLLQPMVQPMGRRLCPCSPWKSTAEQRSTCSPWRAPHRRRWMHPKEQAPGRTLDPWRQESTLVGAAAGQSGAAPGPGPGRGHRLAEGRWRELAPMPPVLGRSAASQAGPGGLHFPWRSAAGAAQARCRARRERAAVAMRRRSAVQRKVPCLFVTEVKKEPSAKRERQPFKVLATETISGKALAADIHNAIPTEKVDGTCCYVTTYKGQPYLWARLDRRPSKQGEKKFRQFLHSLKDCKEFAWNIEEDFKPVPDTWIPAKDLEFSNGNPLPDENGHMPGWVPVEKNSKQYCWHSSVINYEAEIALVLKRHADPGLLEISPVPLSELLEQTLELIGTNINANPYGLGSKKHPVHLLVPHGAFEIKNPPTLKQNDILSWFESCSEGKVEGIVWHCHDGCLIKLHRHHLDLPWPLAETYLNSQPVVISFNRSKYECDFEPKSLFHHFSNLDGQRFDRLKDIKFDA